MCYVFAGQDPETYAYHTRSVRLAGHSTSIRLESKFWTILDEVAAAQDLSMPKFLSQLYDEALEIHGACRQFRVAVALRLPGLSERRGQGPDDRQRRLTVPARPRRMAWQ